MTAEIAVMNKLAVTLAADSAVTIGFGEATKVYNSADKIFEATNHDPIGLMVYNNPEISDVPVEAIVKMYRDRHCHTNFSTVFDFAEAFLKHIADFEAPPITVTRTINRLASRQVYRLRQLLEENTAEFWRRYSEQDDPPIGDALLEALGGDQVVLIDAVIGYLESLPEQDWALGLTVEAVEIAHGVDLAELVNTTFDDIYLSDGVPQKIVRAAALSLLREYEKSTLTGLVFAGFGADEIFPSLVAFEVYGLVADRLKFVRMQRFDVDRQLSPDAVIIPFAQQEMVDRFMFGLDSEFLDLCTKYFAGALTKLKDHLAVELADGDPAVQGALAPAIDAILREFNETVVGQHLDRARDQLSSMVRSMPKQELAALCESLVHITSLKRKFSAGAESVGGPIDVAMITRAEGFVWVKRKHFFDPVFNPRYFKRRYGAVEPQPVGASSPVQG